MNETTVRGLTVNKDWSGWRVAHEASGLEAVSGLRQRRFAEEARTELLATGVDFTASARTIQGQRQRWADVYHRWQVRVQQGSYDNTTFEYYRQSTRYGDFIPSARWAAAMRAATDRGSYDGDEVSRLLNEGNAAVRTVSTSA
jgi:hypothetical protein